MKIASFNVNSVRVRLPIITEWLQKESPDVLGIQETKVQDADFPKTPFNDLGYHVSYKGQKSYNGVAVLSKSLPDKVLTGFDSNDPQEEARLITVYVNQLYVVNTYIPQGQHPESGKFTFKLDWFNRLHKYFIEKFDAKTPVVWIGDLNVAPEPIDVYDHEKLYGSVCYHPEEHKAFQAVKGFGFEDVFRKHRPEEKTFTFWDYRIPNAVKRGLGWRIDHILATQSVADKSRDCWVDLEPRMKPKPSDHTIIVADFDWP
jgi:exodeoxyribonuclease-3